MGWREGHGSGCGGVAGAAENVSNLAIRHPWDFRLALACARARGGDHLTTKCQVATTNQAPNAVGGLIDRDRYETFGGATNSGAVSQSVSATRRPEVEMSEYASDNAESGALPSHLHQQMKEELGHSRHDPGKAFTVMRL